MTREPAGPVVERPDRTLRILLADDHAVVRAALRALLDTQAGLRVIGEAEDGEAAIRQAEALRPDVLVMDISMPRLNGIQAARLVRERCPDVRVLGLSVHQERGFVLQFLKAGASGYVLKRSAASDLLQAIRAVAAGRVYLVPEVARIVVESFAGGSLPHGPPLKGEALSGREAEVLCLVAEGYTNKEIASRLGISVRTVETYKIRSMDKLGLQSRTDMVRYALHEGWLSAP